MKLVRIEDGHHVVRFCKRKHAIRDRGVIVGVFPDFFHLRSSEEREDGEPEKYLSAVYYEYFDGAPSEMMAGCGAAIGRPLRNGEALVRLGVAEVTAEGRNFDFSLRVMHEASHKLTPSKARVEGLPIPANDELAGSLASKAVKEILPG